MKYLVTLALALSALLAQNLSFAATYSLPDGPLPGGCSYDGSQVLCPGDLVLERDAIINVSSPVRLRISGDFTFGPNLQMNAGGAPGTLSLSIGGNVNPGDNSLIKADMAIAGSVNSASNVDLQGNLTVSGNFNLGPDSTVTGDLSASTIVLGQNNVVNGSLVAGSVHINGSNSVVHGNVNATVEVMNSGTINGYVNSPSITNTGTIAGDECNINDNVGPCVESSPAVLYYLIEHAGTVLTCEAAELLVHACADETCDSKVASNADFQLQATGPVSIAVSGTFAGAGSAAVQLALGSPGDYTLSLATVSAPASESSRCQNPSGCNLSSVQTAFKWQSIPAQAAGVPFASQLQAIRSDTQTGACVAAVQGTTTVELAVSCVNPDVCSSAGALLDVDGQSLTELPAYSTVQLTFDNSGTAPIPLNYEDAGAVRLHARKTLDNGAQLQGSSNSFVVKPYAIGFRFSKPQPYPADVFAQAGEAFRVELSALAANGSITPNFGKEAVPQRLALGSTAQTQIPVDGVDGQVNQANTFTRVADGLFRSTEVSYGEVGQAIFSAGVAGGSYLGAGDVQGQSSALGRFIPGYFSLDLGYITAACEAQVPAFTYLGQPFELTLELHARNLQGAVTQNYPSAADPARALLVAAEDADTYTSLTDRLGSTELAIVWVNGMGSVAGAEVVLERRDDGTPDGPLDLQLGLRIDDQETADPLQPLTPLRPRDFDDTVADCPASASCTAAFVDSSRVVFGRMQLADIYGPENENLPVNLQARFWNGTHFVRNTDDNCTRVDPSLLSFDPAHTTPADWEPQADGPGEVALQQGRNPAHSLYWLAPLHAAGFPFSYAAPSWLQDAGSDPAASAQFGHYRGHDRVLYWRLLGE